MLARPKNNLYGLLAEFDEPHHLRVAARKAREAGFTRFDAYSSFPIHGMGEAIGFTRTRVPLLCLIGAVCGATFGYIMLYYASVIDYPIIIGGRPYNSWPNWIPIMFELTILLGGLSAAIGMLALNGLPKPYHPVFNAPNFEMASRDKFFLCIEADDPRFDLDQTRRFLSELKPAPSSVVIVPLYPPKEQRGALR